VLSHRNGLRHIAARRRTGWDERQSSPRIIVVSEVMKHSAWYLEVRDAGLDGSLRAPARLAIVPGATHYDILSTDAVAKLAIPFLQH
jgi:hypothetical protein